MGCYDATWTTDAFESDDDAIKVALEWLEWYRNPNTWNSENPPYELSEGGNISKASTDVPAFIAEIQRVYKEGSAD